MPPLHGEEVILANCRVLPTGRLLPASDISDLEDDCGQGGTSRMTSVMNGTLTISISTGGGETIGMTEEAGERSVPVRASTTTSRY